MSELTVHGQHISNFFELLGDDENARKCCNFEGGDGGRRERNGAARSQAARSNSLSMN